MHYYFSDTAVSSQVMQSALLTQKPAMFCWVNNTAKQVETLWGMLTIQYFINPPLPLRRIPLQLGVHYISLRAARSTGSAYDSQRDP